MEWLKSKFDRRRNSIIGGDWDLDLPNKKTPPKRLVIKPNNNIVHGPQVSGRPSQTTTISAKENIPSENSVDKIEPQPSLRPYSAFMSPFFNTNATLNKPNIITHPMPTVQYSSPNVISRPPGINTNAPPEPCNSVIPVNNINMDIIQNTLAYDYIWYKPEFVKFEKQTAYGGKHYKPTAANVYIHTLNLSNCGIEYGNLTVFNFVRLAELDMSNNKLSYIPYILPTSIEILRLNNNHIDRYSSSICDPKNMKILDLANNLITTIPEKIHELVKLEEIDFSDNRITKFSSNITKLSKLRVLKINNNRIDTLPETLGDLVMLHELGLHGNPIKVLPLSMILLTNLKKLDIGNININFNNLELFNHGLPSLIELNISNNGLTSIPNKLPITLRSLDISNNKLKNLLEKINELSRLTTLNLSTNDISDLEIIKLNKIRVFKASNNNITKLPDIITSWSGLKEIDMSNNNLQSLPLSIMTFNRLKRVNITGNKELIIDPLIQTFLKDMVCV